MKMPKIPTEIALTVGVILGLGSIWFAESNFGRIFGLCCFGFSLVHTTYQCFISKETNYNHC